jgi:hypothetical protein
MIDKNQQSELMKKVEELFTESCARPLRDIEKELARLGFTEKGADPIAVALEHRSLELYLEIKLDEDRCIHSYFLIPFDEKEKKQRKFRW